MHGSSSDTPGDTDDDNGRWYDKVDAILRRLRRFTARFPKLHAADRALGRIQIWLHLQWQLNRRRGEIFNRINLEPDEKILIPKIWLAEVFTPSRSDDLRDQLRQTGWIQRLSPGHTVDQLDEWLEAQRQSKAFGSWRLIATVHDHYNRNSLAYNPTTDRVPAEFSSVEISAVSVSPSMTVVIAGFNITDARQSFATELLNAEYPPRLVRRAGRRMVESGDWAKEMAVRAERERLVSAASRWLRTRLRGSFASFPSGRHPALSLLITRTANPAPPENEQSAPYLRALDLDSISDRWRCREFPGLTLHRQRDSFWLPDLGDRHTLAGRMADALPEEAYEGHGAARSSRSIGDILEQYDVRNVVVVLAIDTLIGAYETSNAHTRDLARKTHQKWAIASSAQLRDSLLTSSLDVGSIAAEIGGEENRLARGLRRHLLEFESFGIDKEIREQYQLSTSLWDSKFASQAEAIKELQQEDSQLRSILGTVASLNSAMASSRLQRVALFVALSSMTIAVLALLISNEFLDVGAVYRQFVTWFSANPQTP